MAFNTFNMNGGIFVGARGAEVSLASNRNQSKANMWVTMHPHLALRVP